MNMKRILSLALTALLLVCLPAWALAAMSIEFSGKRALTAQELSLAENDLFIKITAPNSTIILSNAAVKDGRIYIDTNSPDVKSVTLELMGDNSISSTDTRFSPITSEIPLTITGDGSLTCKSDDQPALDVAGDLTIKSGTVTAEGGSFGIDVAGGNFFFFGDELSVQGSYGGVVERSNDAVGTEGFCFDLKEYPNTPEGYIFKAWSVNGEEMQPGDIVDTQGSERVTVKPILEKLPTSNALPQTGDNSSMMLWAALAVISMGGVTMLARRKRSA
ncbi:MAG: LPXTG cell wall anchor domain-containing protein [Clostridia bacterium]|nr:LPXTG cell wall anchor domain-containing protein [Clostridia bacterium]